MEGSNLGDAALLSALLDASSCALCAVDRDLNLLAFNDAFSMRAVAASGHFVAVGDLLLETTSSPVERELLRTRVASAFGGASHTESRWIGQGAARRYLRVRITPITLGGSVVAVGISAEDRTNLVESENRLRILEAVVDSSGDAMASWDMDGIVSSWSAGAAQLYGYGAEEMIGRHIEVLMPPGHEDDVPMMMRVVSQGQRIVRLEANGIRKDGTVVDIELTVGPIYDEFGAIVGASAISHNITERRAIEEALRSSEAKFEAAFRTSPDSVNINRMSDGVYVEINEGFTTLTGYEAQEVIGRSSLDLGIWADRSDRERLIAELRERGRADNLIARFRIKDGSLRQGVMSARIIVIEGEPHVLSVTRDRS